MTLMLAMATIYWLIDNYEYKYNYIASDCSYYGFPTHCDNLCGCLTQGKVLLC